MKRRRPIKIPPRDLGFTYVRSSGPGGQNVNKVATTAQLRFDLRGSESLSPETRERLTRLAGKKVNAAGKLVIEARRYRTREANRRDALRRLERLIEKASVKPRPRRKTKPSPAAQLRRLERKRRQSQLKRLRAKVLPGD